jgi:peptidoglycan/xylan/chitin deacetylase (PgdA/CDA1 family)
MLKSAILSLFRFFRPGLSSGAILMYHSVGNSGAFFNVTSEDFNEQMSYLSRKKYTVVSLSEFVARLRAGKSVAGHVAITFDDGYKDFATEALPILRRYNFPASVFLISDFLGKLYTTSDGVTMPILSLVEAQKAEQGGRVEYFPHTARHLILDSVPLADAIGDIESSKAYIAEHFHSSADIFAYPKGRYTREVVEYLRTGNFAGAVTVREGLVKPASDPFLLPRLSVDSSTSLAQFKGKLSDGFGFYTFLRTGR